MSRSFRSRSLLSLALLTTMVAPATAGNAGVVEGFTAAGEIVINSSTYGYLPTSIRARCSATAVDGDPLAGCEPCDVEADDGGPATSSPACTVHKKLPRKPGLVSTDRKRKVIDKTRCARKNAGCTVSAFVVGAKDKKPGPTALALTYTPIHDDRSVERPAFYFSPDSSAVLMVVTEMAQDESYDFDTYFRYISLTGPRSASPYTKLALFPADGHRYPVTVVSEKSGRFTVRAADGDQWEVGARDLTPNPLRFQVDQVVVANVGGRGWAPGRVVSVELERVSIKLDAGGAAMWVPIEGVVAKTDY